MELSCRLGWALGSPWFVRQVPVLSFHTGRNSAAGEVSGGELGCAKGVFPAGCLPRWQVRFYPGTDRCWVCFVWKTGVQMLVCRGKSQDTAEERLFPRGSGCWRGVGAGLGSGEALRGCRICLLHRELPGCRMEKYSGAQPHFRGGLLRAGGDRSGRSHG